MDLKKKLRQIRNYINEQQVHDDQKFNIKRTRLINFIYSLDLDEVKRFKETKTTETTNKTMKEQKINDVKEYHVDVVVMGSDWAGSDRFDYLKDYCEVVYLDRTEGVSTTKIKKDLGLQEPKNDINQIPTPSK